MADSINVGLGTVRLPSAEDRLFSEADDPWMNACLDWYHDPSELYVVGYKEAADALVETVSRREGSADSLSFPIVFLYRQYIELRLKSLLRDGTRLLGQQYTEKSEHRLSPLWNKVKELLLAVWPESEFAAGDSLIDQFEKVDPKSTSFRYPKGLEGKHSVNIQTLKINLRNLADVIGALSVVLEGAAGGISEYEQYR